MIGRDRSTPMKRGASRKGLKFRVATRYRVKSYIGRNRDLATRQRCCVPRAFGCIDPVNAGWLGECVKCSLIWGKRGRVRCVARERGCADPGEPKGEPERKESSKEGESEGEIYTESKEKKDQRERERERERRTPYFMNTPPFTLLITSYTG